MSNWPAKEELRQEVLASLERIKEAIEFNIYNEGRQATGDTERSLLVESTPNGGQLTGRAAFDALEHGRAPGGVPPNMVDLIKRWIVAKGITVKQIPYKRKQSANWRPKYSVAARSLTMAAGAITHSIKTKGTALYRTGVPDNVIYSPAIENELTELDKRVLQIIVNTILQ